MFDQNSSIDAFINLASYIIAPVFYLSIVYYVEPNRKWRKRDNLHFLFVVLMLLLTILSFIVPPSSAETAVEKKVEAAVILIFTAAFCLQVFTYCLFAFHKITRYQQNLLTYASNTERISLQWLKKNVVCVILIAVLWLADAVFKISEGSLVFDYTSTLLYFIGIYYIAYYGLQQKEIFPFNTIEKLQLDTIIDQAQKEAEGKKKLVTDEKLADYVQMLGQLMNVEKPYLDFEISLIRLASQFDTSPHLLSYIINNGFGENFFQFINRYRVEEAKRLILDPKMNHLNLVGIAYEAGFNSKTVFNTTFKKTTGQTPTEFKKNHNPLSFNQIPDVRIDKLEQ
ncbi:MAG: AraC family transcriptional regulator [Dyadobacter sp.]|uniref:helix-turn-helix domain-containing protein n=1 Tax=Dyadobacter sp. TaxID=1914288 RepID=UPI00326493CF